MKPSITKNLLIAATLIIAFGCEDFLEKDLSDKAPTLIAPADSVETLHQNLTFAWESMEGAENYRLIVVSPSFERAELYLLDTLVEKLSFGVTLTPRQYEWKVRAENSAYESLYTQRTFTIIEKEE